MYTINYKSYFKILINILFILFISIKNSNSDTTINTSAKYALLMDHDTGRILLNKNSDVKMSPASMSKLMTIYLTFEAIKQAELEVESKDEDFKTDIRALIISSIKILKNLQLSIIGQEKIKTSIYQVISI